MKQIITLKEPQGKVNNSEDIFNNISKINIDYEQENLLVFYLSTSNQIIGDAEVLFKGGLNCCTIDSKTIFRKALLKNANSVIIAHNHPSGNINPSEEDKKAFKDLKKVGLIIGIQVLDSIIFTPKEYHSLN